MTKDAASINTYCNLYFQLKKCINSIECITYNNFGMIFNVNNETASNFIRDFYSIQYLCTEALDGKFIDVVSYFGNTN